MIKILFKPVSLLLGALSGVVAGHLFEQVWKHVDDENEAPSPTQKDAGWRKVLLGAALNAVIYAVVDAAVTRVGATGVEKATGTWPGQIEAHAA